MLDHLPPAALRSQYEIARRSTPDIALLAFGELCTGKPAWLANRGHVLHVATSAAPRLSVCRPEVEMKVVETVDDPALAFWSLQLSSVAPIETDAAVLATLQPAVLATRLGLLSSCLDTAFLHLEGRESFGRQLLHQQLIKATFATTHAAIVGLLETITQPSIANHTATCLGMHEAITHHFASAAKLMGGHGFLTGGCHSLEYIAALMLAVHGPKLAADHQPMRAQNALFF
ncbi:hypothetical protein PsW64_02609 [Pseudovibrio sp. W64]|uniref:hypothetical protein n=1 Tax=Pseudovibrio TaxID=258255 RepID=UPI0007AE482F|nr:hypothetical protein [Pseudovibrio sp. W64]KZK81525.1 hypothetical protein PsW64_02609 [Pseudovibrio sp. W64]